MCRTYQRRMSRRQRSSITAAAVPPVGFHTRAVDIRLLRSTTFACVIDASINAAGHGVSSGGIGCDGHGLGGAPVALRAPPKARSSGATAARCFGRLVERRLVLDDAGDGHILALKGLQQLRVHMITAAGGTCHRHERWRSLQLRQARGQWILVLMSTSKSPRHAECLSHTGQFFSRSVASDSAAVAVLATVATATAATATAAGTDSDGRRAEMELNF